MFPVKFDPNPNILLNQIQQETNLNKDQVVPAVSFIEMIQKLSKSAKEQNKKDAEIQKEIESKIQSEIKSGTKLDLNLMNLIANKVMSDEIKKVNDSIKMQQARKAYERYSMIKLPVRFRKNFAYGWGYVVVKDGKYLYDQKFYEDIEAADIIDDYDEANLVADSFGAELKTVKIVNGKTVIIED